MDLAIALTDNGTGFDLALTEGGDLSTESGLRSAVIYSLYTDARARADDEIPDGTDDRRGTWSDAYLPEGDESEGSRDWLLDRSKETPETLARSEQYGREALQWLIDDGVAKAIAVTAEWLRAGVLGRRVVITLHDGTQFDDVF